MLLKFTLRDRLLIFDNPEIIPRETQVSFIQCKIDLKSRIFRASDTLIAVFKSASYNIEEEVLLDINYDIKDDEIINIYSFAHVPSKVFEHGGVVQLLIYKYKDYNDTVVQEATNTVEFYIDPRKYVPFRTSAFIQQLANLFHEVQTQVLGMTVDAHESDVLSVTKSIIDGAINLSFGLVRGPQGIQGIQGVKGDKGDTGERGPQGIQGEDGVGISSITKTGTAGLVDTYTITFTDGTTTTYNVTNGRDGESTGGDVNDVKVDGISVVTEGVAEIDLSGKADISDIPTKVSDLTNDSGFITSASVPTKTSDLTNDSGFISSETDPTVPSWAKQQNKPSYMFSEIYGTPTTLSEYGITDAYTKSEVDVLVSAVLHFKGTKATVSLLPSSGNKTGDVWHITSDGSEWAWDGSQWQELGTSVDLSGYVPTSRKINGNALTSDITLNIPSKTSDLLNDSGFITSATLPTEVYWADYGSTTYSDLRTAYMANKLIVLIAYRIGLSKYDGSVFTFVGFDSQTRIIQATLDSAGTWNMTWHNTPSKTSDLTNDSGFITSASVPTKTSDLTNDSGFITAASLTEEVFWATYGTTTSAQIEAAYQAGKVVCVKYNSFIYTLNYRGSAVMHFFGSDIAETHYSLSCDNNVWSASTTYYPPLDANDKIIDSYLPDYHDIYWATYGTTTNAEIDTAINAGKIPMVAVGGRALPLRYATTSFHRFACVDNGTEYTVTCASNTWGASTQSFVPVGSSGKIDASYLPVYDGGVTP